MPNLNKSPSIFITASLIFAFIFLLASYFYPRTNIEKAIFEYSYWPLSPAKRLQLAKTYFKNNYPSQAQKQYNQAKTLYQKIGFLDHSNKSKQQFQQTKELLSKEQTLKQQKLHWQNINQIKPNYPHALLQLSLINYQLFEDQSAQQLWQQAFYLDPNNEEIQKVGIIIN
jgi:tetratricopeptide (TPR) repeat protein